MKSDVLIIGGGIAGLSLAIKLSQALPDKSIVVLTKTDDSESNTRYAQGGIAAVWNLDSDNIEKHIEDTMIAGDHLSNPEVVRYVVTEGPARVQEMIDWGTRFDKDISGNTYNLAREGGHSEHRILHYKDLTGWEMMRALLEKVRMLPNVQVLEHYFAVDIITQHHQGYMVTRTTPNIVCFGAYALNKNTRQIETFLARTTVMATGGIGQVYRATTNPIIATGDGIAMVYRAKGRVANMEFVQFHPTSLYQPGGQNPVFLVSEAVRGKGAILKTPTGEEFMHRYHHLGSLAPRDIVSRAIDSEMKALGADFMLLDCRHINQDEFYNHFPTITDKCRSIGIDPATQMIPVVPACHYICGGILTDVWGRTTISRLYAIGECAYTGLHGANRLASNSLLEALVFADRISRDIVQHINGYNFADNIPDWNAEGTTEPQEMVLITQSVRELKDLMSYYVGIVRSNIRLKRALDRLFLLYNETENLYQSTSLSPQLCELRNLITIGYLIARSASHRRESRGLHYTTDYPGHLPFLENTIL